MFDNEKDFELALCAMLSQKGWEPEVINCPSEKDLLQNWADILFQNNNTIDRLNDCPLTEGEMQQLLEQIEQLRTPQRLNGFINGKTVSICRDNTNDTLHFGKEITLKVFDPHEIAAGQSRYQIVRQPRFSAPSHLLPSRRGDIMLLINGMPLIHVELKKSGIPVSQATNQIEKYSREGIFTGIFRLIQIFVAMNPEETVYFANPGEDGKFNRDFYFHWADFNNQPMNDWKEIATHLLSIPMAHQLIGYYTIADRTDGVLKVLRSYQYNAVKKISEIVAMHRDWTDTDHQLGGYIWHTTGSGKTMSSFKAAQLIADSGNADKVIFVIDRIELGTQSAREYRNFSELDDDIQETEDTQELITKLKSPEVKNKLIVSSIQKLGIIADGTTIRSVDLEKINRKRIVFIVDECHRSTFGDNFQAIKRTFPYALFFGFTGTPIITANSHNSTTDDIFGNELHRYSIADGIRDKNVLGFDTYKVLTYRDRDIREQVALRELGAQSLQDIYDDTTELGEKRRELLNVYLNTMPMTEIEAYIPSLQYQMQDHCEAVVEDVIDTMRQKSQGGKFHAIFTTTSIPQAIVYYHLFKANAPHLNVTALFDPSLDNDNPGKVMYKENGLVEIIQDYNEKYHQNFTIPTHAKFKKDLSNRLAHKKPYINLQPEQRIDLLIVVSQMLTGFDSKWINTLYVDKMLESADLIQAFSRTNRLYGPDKPFGTIKYYQRPHTMEKNIEAAVKQYSGDKPLGLFVCKLDINIGGMNQIFAEMQLLFAKEHIQHFSRLPEAPELRGQFAKKFREYNQYLEAAKVQGFYWGKQDYITPEGVEVSVLHKEHQYNTLVQRYKELFSNRTGGGSGIDLDLPYDIDSHLTEINTGQIDNDYMNYNFQRYIHALEQPNISQKELDDLLNDLSSSFAALPQEEQEFAEIFMYDIQSGNITLEPGKTCRDYITAYMTTVKEQRISHLAEVFGLNHELLSTMMSMRVTEQNIDEFGRFTNLQNTINIEKAQAYFRDSKGENMTIFEAHVKAGELLRKFILRNGFDI
jgi:type I restriction enzyme R subunit